MTQFNGGPVWKVGELAQATGLTVRTLHHWHELSLVTPSTRTASGHRLYREADIRRVYEVVALRGLGLPLEDIGSVLDGVRVGEVLEAHMSQVRAQLAALRSLETRLSTLLSHVGRTEPLTTPDLLHLIDEVSKMTETFGHYFTEEQIAALQQRRARLGDDYIREVENEWPQLISKVQAEMDAGTDPAEPRVQALAKRWMELVEAFDGGDPDLREAYLRMRAENAAELERACGPSEALIQYVRRVNQARQC